MIALGKSGPYRNWTGLGNRHLELPGGGLLSKQVIKLAEVAVPQLRDLTPGPNQAQK